MPCSMTAFADELLMVGPVSAALVRVIVIFVATDLCVVLYQVHGASSHCGAGRCPALWLNIH